MEEKEHTTDKIIRTNKTKENKTDTNNKKRNKKG